MILRLAKWSMVSGVELKDLKASLVMGYDVKIRDNYKGNFMRFIVLTSQGN